MLTSVRDRVAAAGLFAAFAVLLLVGVAGPSAAKPGLGPRGWAPGDLAWAPSSALTTALLWTAYAVGALAVALRLASSPAVGATAGALSGPAARARRRLAPGGWALPVALGVLALLTGPFGSGDHTNYAAYGRITVEGGDPYLTAPSQWSAHDPVTSLVEPPWADTVSIYGPFATVVQALTSLVGGANLRQTVWVWQVLVVLAWLGVRWLLLRAGATPRRVDTLWTLNPVVFGIGVLGAHVDLLAAALALAALVLAVRSPLLAGVVAGLALSTKITYGVVGLAILLAWWTQARPGWVARAARLGAGALVVAVPLHLWAGPHVFDQLNRARRSISFATPWRLLYELLSGPMTAGHARTLVTTLSLVLALVLVVVLLRVTRATTPPTLLGASARWALVLAGGYTLAAAYSLPWYDLLLWATLPILGAGVLDRILLLRLVAMAAAYVPGRVVGMSASVERLTLGVRRDVVPYAVLLVWGWLTRAGWSGSRRPSGTRPPAP